MALGVYPAARGLTSLIVEALKADGRPDVVTDEPRRARRRERRDAGVIAAVVGVCIGISIGAVVERRTRFAVLTSSWDCPSEHAGGDTCCCSPGS